MKSSSKNALLTLCTAAVEARRVGQDDVVRDHIKLITEHPHYCTRAEDLVEMLRWLPGTECSMFKSVLVEMAKELKT